MEPRTSSVKNRLRAVEELSKAGIPVNVNMAPIIPGINSDEIFALVEEVSKRGALSVQYIMARLNGQIATIFEDWVHKALPERAEKIIALIRETHGGTLNESRWKTRMKGEGHYAETVAAMFRVARKKFLPPSADFQLDYSQFVTNTEKQMTLF
jgi:DNA repair photolyase